MKYFIKTFGCAANVADSERIATVLENRGMKRSKTIKGAGTIVINTCIVRESAENRVYGLLDNLQKMRDSGPGPSTMSSGPNGQNDKKIILTGCLVGLAVRDKTGKMMKRLMEKFPMVDEFLPIDEVGFNNLPTRIDKVHALVPISNGCNNFCTYCVVPYTRGREVSRPYKDIIDECKNLKSLKFKRITLVGQNVNSYGSDLKSKLKPVMVKHLGRMRIPTLFPFLLEEVAKMGFETVDFISSNPWDFSDELIEVIVRNSNISRNLHLPVQSGDNEILKRMNRWYTTDEYLRLVKKIKSKIKNIKLSTDIIVGFPGETEEQFQNTVTLCKKVGFVKAYISQYSPRPLTPSFKTMKDGVSSIEKHRRWKILEGLINTQ